MDPFTMSLVGMGIGFGGKILNNILGSDTFDPLTGDYGINGDYSYNAETDFGQGTALQNMDRYGFGGAYQKYLTGEVDRMKEDEMRRIQKLASSLTPGTASLRGGVASQGVGGSTSNVIARQQREQGMSKAMDQADQLYEQNVGSLDKTLLSMTGQNEAMRLQSSQDYMRGIGMKSSALNQASEFNVGNLMKKDMFNQQQLLSRDQFNRRGEAQENMNRFNAWNDMFGDIAGIGSSMFGNYMAGKQYKDMMGFGNTTNSEFGYLRSNGYTPDGRGGYDWISK